MDSIDALKGMDPEQVKLLLQQFPTQEPPDGQETNFINPESIASQLKITVCVFLPFMIIFLALRLYAAIRVRSKFGSDDYLSVVAGLSVIGWSVVELLLSDGSTPLGVHAWNVSAYDSMGERYIRLTCASMVFYCIASFFIKTTLLVLYNRLFSPVRTARIIVWVAIATMAIFYIICASYSIYLLTPKSTEIFTWVGHLATIGPSSRRLSFVMGLFGLITDIMTLVFPIILIIPLKLSFQKKLGAAAVFLTGLVACGCSLGGCVTRGLQINSADETFKGTYTQILGVTELLVGHMCSCMPVTAVVFKSTAQWAPIRSIIKSFTSFTYRGTQPSDHIPLDDTQSVNGLPRVPEAHHMTGLRTFIRKVQRTRGETTVVNTMGMTNLSQSSLVDMEYHNHLKREQTPTSQLESRTGGGTTREIV